MQKAESPTLGLKKADFDRVKETTLVLTGCQRLHVVVAVVVAAVVVAAALSVPQPDYCFLLSLPKLLFLLR